METLKYIQDEKLKTGAVIKKSYIGETSAFYKNVKVTGSRAQEGVSVGDNSIIFECVLGQNVNINRNVNAAYSEVGFATYINHNTTLRNARVGKFCSVSWNVSIGGKNHDYNNISQYPPYWWKKLFSLDEVKDERSFRDCVIGNDVWIGSGANILRQVEVGHGSVIAAGAIVTKDVPPYSIVMGAPASVYKKRFDEDTIAKLLEIKWWDWPLETIRENVHLLNTHMDEESLEKMRRISLSLQNPV